MKEDTERWLISAESDLGAARLLTANGFHRHAVFFTHLYVEKVLKALITERFSIEEVERTHNLPELLARATSGAPARLAEFLGRLSAHSTTSRYALASERSVYTSDFARSMLDGAEEAAEWLRQQLT